MRTSLTVLIVLLVFGVVSGTICRLPAQEKDRTRQLLPRDSVWKQKYDSKLDGELKDDLAEVSWTIAVRNNRITGVRVGNEDPEQNSRLTGEIVDGTHPIITVRHDAPNGYVSFWIGKRVEETRVIGTWFDSTGGSGDFEIVVEKK